MRPVQVFYFLLLCLVSLALTSYLIEKLGIRLPDQKAILPDFTESFTTKVDSTAIIEEKKKVEEAKTLAEKKEAILKKPSRSTADTLVLMQVEAMESPAKFYFANDDRSVMDKFFSALEETRRDNTAFRIIHYGDSQIEMDRISSYIREQLQRTYGGSGMGLLPALEVTPKYTVDVQSTGSWTRKLTFGSSDYRARHNRYGPMAYFCQKDPGAASVSITAREGTSFKNSHFNKCKVLVGALDNPLDISVSANGRNVGSKTLNPSAIEQVLAFDVDSAKGRVSLRFNGGKADILGISLEGDHGVSLDNIPMRGCSGTVFRRINPETLRRTYEMLGVKMVILQFGGNALPGMSNKSSADAYGKKFAEEIKFLKSVDPNLIVFVIGPADMSVRVNGVFQTHQQLENVRDALRRATLEAGGVFWDMYEAMGGKNSMVDWVKSKPALGSPDYIHFTQKGAVKISEIFYASLMKEHEMYLLRKKLLE